MMLAVTRKMRGHPLKFTIAVYKKRISAMFQLKPEFAKLASIHCL